MELSTASKPAGQLSTSSCRFALHPIVSIAHDGHENAPLVWSEALIRPRQSLKTLSPLALVEDLYRHDSLGTDIAILKRITRWLSTESAPQRVSVNIHPESLTHSLFLATAVQALKGLNEVGHSLCLELIEFGYCCDRRLMARNANHLRRNGALIALDDFGSQLNFFDMCAAGIVDFIKIDISVTDGIDHCPNRRAIALGIKTLADGLDAQVVAEGIETEAQLQTLRDLGITYGQGYFIHKPFIEEGI